MALNFWQLLSLSVIAPFFYRIGMTMCPFKEPTFPLLGICTGEVKLCVQRLVSVFSIPLVQLQAIWIFTNGLTKKGEKKSMRLWTGLKHNAAGEVTQGIQCLPPSLRTWVPSQVPPWGRERLTSESHPLTWSMHGDLHTQLNVVLKVSQQTRRAKWKKADKTFHRVWFHLYEILLRTRPI